MPSSGTAICQTIPALLLVAATAGCSGEAREVGPSRPQTRPASDGDPRIAAYQDNRYQLSQGGRYFTWYGCAACHGETADPTGNLADGRWRHGGGFAQVFGAIADRHPRQDYGRRVPVETLWQITAYVRDLPRHTPEKRRRVATDQTAESQGPRWTGPQ